MMTKMDVVNELVDLYMNIYLKNEHVAKAVMADDISLLEDEMTHIEKILLTIVDVTDEGHEEFFGELFYEFVSGEVTKEELIDHLVHAH